MDLQYEIQHTRRLKIPEEKSYDYDSFFPSPARPTAIITAHTCILPVSASFYSLTNMPYNTRRKSLSLPSLGIHVPISNAARAAALANRHAQAQAQSHTTSGSASPSSSSVAHSASSLSSLSTSSSASSPTFSPRSPTDRDRDRDRDSMNLAAEAQTSSARKIKRSRTADDRERSAPAAKRRQTDANTPPPSPGSRNPSRAISIEMDDVDDNGYDSAASDVGPEIDMSSINDEIVEAVIVQLQATRNRPHIVKELAAVLMGQLKIVQQYACSPCLAGCLSAMLAPCPVPLTNIPCAPTDPQTPLPSFPRDFPAT